MNASGSVVVPDLLATIHSVASGIEIVHDRADRRRIRRVEDAQVEVALGGPERPPEDVRREAGAAHAHDDRRS